MKIFAASLVIVTTLLGSAHAQADMVLNQNRVHLRSGDVPEWDDFADATPNARRMDIRFNAQANQGEMTLFVRQDEVRQDWNVELNGRRIGRLFLMEADLVHTISVPPNALRDGENTLSILPPRENDDILLHEIVLAEQPVLAAAAAATVELRVADSKTRALMPSRITIVDAHGALAALIPLTNGLPSESAVTPANRLAARPGVVYTGNGFARIGLRAGSYAFYASRGFEFSVATQKVAVARGQVQRVDLSLTREVPTPNLVSCDTHVHTFTYSRHGDVTTEERMLTLAGEHIELPISTDHNLHIDYGNLPEQMGVAKYLTSVTGNEVTTPAGHFNVFPVQPEARVPDFKVTDWPRLMTQLRSTPNVRVVVLNHPRNVHNNFQPFASTNFNNVTGENKRGPEFTFDAMELLNSSAQQSDYMLVYRDWFALLNYGYRITALGSSDSHDVSRYIVGQGRTYIACPDSDPAKINVGTACAGLVAGRAYVSMGLLPVITVNKRFGVSDLATDVGGEIEVEVKVLGPSWVNASRVELFANGTRIKEADLTTAKSTEPGTKGIARWSIRRPAHDVHLVAIATGPGVTAPFWAIPRPYQPTSRAWTGRVIGSTNPVWIDADGDGRFTAARAYAKTLVDKHVANPAELVRALANFDEAVAAQAAGLCTAAKLDIRSSAFSDPLKSAAAPVQRGFAAFAATLQ